jgi:acyl-ACP thioesterase
MGQRVVTITRTIGLADVGPDTRVRLDALARIVQDVADADLASAPRLEGMGLWILRRMSLEIAHTPRLRADVTARTWCSGVGPRWAERRSELQVAEQHCVDVTALWVHTEVATRVPALLPPGFGDLWGVDPTTPRVKARLTHGSPPDGTRRVVWPLRAVDFDVLDHVNNAAYWAAAEEELAARGSPRVRDAEIEFRSGIDRGELVELRIAETGEGFAMWFCVRDTVRASILVGCSA